VVGARRPVPELRTWRDSRDALPLRLPLLGARRLGVRCAVEDRQDCTFYANGKTSPPITNGPLYFITRTGTLTIYRDLSHNSNFKKRNTFKDGTPVLVATYRHQPIASSLTNAISLFSHDQITFTRPFETAHGMVQLGTVGETFDEHYVGQGNMPGPPSGYFIGYATNG